MTGVSVPHGGQDRMCGVKGPIQVHIDNRTPQTRLKMLHCSIGRVRPARKHENIDLPKSLERFLSKLHHVCHDGCICTLHRDVAVLPCKLFLKSSQTILSACCSHYCCSVTRKEKCRGAAYSAGGSDNQYNLTVYRDSHFFKIYSDTTMFRGFDFIRALTHNSASALRCRPPSVQRLQFTTPGHRPQAYPYSAANYAKSSIGVLPVAWFSRFFRISRQSITTKNGDTSMGTSLCPVTEAVRK